ncbi:unnamed protein product [Orchesella dallaii]|uniref:Solute carrier family 25 member 44 n=1 Tax=Orchesella dallaii TaxID=48710 RepID=A0ABP1PY95_9HEXA
MITDLKEKMEAMKNVLSKFGGSIAPLPVLCFNPVLFHNSDKASGSSSTSELWTGFGGSHQQHRPFSSDWNKQEDQVLARLAPSGESQIQVIEWNMMNKWRFYPLSMISSFTIRCLLYPFTLVKTKMQIQQKQSVYTGMWDCISKIVDSEGVRGLYRGFWISAFQIVSGVFYVSTYEGVRQSLYHYGIRDSHVRALVAGGCASVVGQTCIVPFDVISQHMMIVGMQQTNGKGAGSVYNPLGIKYEGRTKVDITKDIAREIYRRDGLRGFYRGYLASLSTYVPNSALWWGFYQIYQEELDKIFPQYTSRLLLQCTAAMLGGFTTTVITNPLDVCRARLQVQRLPSFPKTFAMLWQEEGYRFMTKGLSARIVQSGVFSVFIILGYESIKRLSIREDYQDQIRW